MTMSVLFAELLTPHNAEMSAVNGATGTLE
jgi:hypothetical protein